MSLPAAPAWAPDLPDFVLLGRDMLVRRGEPGDVASTEIRRWCRAAGIGFATLQGYELSAPDLVAAIDPAGATRGLLLLEGAGDRLAAARIRRLAETRSAEGLAIPGGWVLGVARRYFDAPEPAEIVPLARLFEEIG